MAPSTDRWNPLRLLETLNFFGEVPFIGNIRWLQQMLGAKPNPQAPSAREIQPASEVVLRGEDTAGAESIRAMVKTRGIAVRSSSLSPTDSPLPDSDPQRIVNTRAVVWVGTPGDEDRLASQAVAIAAAAASQAAELLDFRTASREQVQEIWGAVDDVVMGGVSASGLSLLPGYGRFSGVVSTENSGGFASVRTRNFAPPFDLTGWQGVRLVLRGDGQRYKVILRNSENWDSLAYCASVDTEADTWMGVDIPFAAFRATFRARTQPTAPPLNPASVCSFQLMLSKFEYDGDKNPHFQPGAFSLDMRALGVYRMVPPPVLVAIAAAPEQAATYTERLAQSGLPHQVAHIHHEPEVAAALDRALA